MRNSFEFSVKCFVFALSPRIAGRRIWLLRANCSGVELLDSFFDVVVSTTNTPSYLVLIGDKSLAIIMYKGEMVDQRMRLKMTKV